MNLENYISLNIKVLTKYLKNPNFPGRATGIEVCLHKIKEAESTGVFNKKDARDAKLELKEFTIFRKFKKKLDQVNDVV